VADLAVYVLIAIGVTAQLACCAGLVVMRDAYDRLHYSAAATTVGPFALLAATLIRVHLTASGLEAIAAVAFLFLANPLLVTATARAARADYGEEEGTSR